MPAGVDLHCFASAWPPAEISNLFTFTGGNVGTNIGDGGMDMYDGGNELRLRVSGEWTPALSYTQVCDGPIDTPTGLGDAIYDTCKLRGSAGLFAAAFHSPTSAIDWIVSPRLSQRRSPRCMTVSTAPPTVVLSTRCSSTGGGERP